MRQRRRAKWRSLSELPRAARWARPIDSTWSRRPPGASSSTRAPRLLSAFSAFTAYGCPSRTPARVPAQRGRAVFQRAGRAGHAAGERRVNVAVTLPPSRGAGLATIDIPRQRVPVVVRAPRLCRGRPAPHRRHGARPGDLERRPAGRAQRARGCLCPASVRRLCVAAAVFERNPPPLSRAHIAHRPGPSGALVLAAHWR